VVVDLAGLSRADCDTLTVLEVERDWVPAFSEMGDPAGAEHHRDVRRTDGADPVSDPRPRQQVHGGVRW